MVTESVIWRQTVTEMGYSNFVRDANGQVLPTYQEDAIVERTY